MFFLYCYCIVLLYISTVLRWIKVVNKICSLCGSDHCSFVVLLSTLWKCAAQIRHRLTYDIPTEEHHGNNNINNNNSKIPCLSRCPGVHRALVVQTENAQMGWHWFRGARAGLSYGMWRCLAQLQILIWKLLLARQALQPSWQRLTRWSSMLDCHHRVNSSRLRWSPTGPSTGMIFSSWASWAYDWWRRLRMFEHLRFCFNGFPLWCNDLILFCCTMVLLTMTGQSRVHYQTNLCKLL